MFTRETKRYRYCTGSIFVPPADADHRPGLLGIGLLFMPDRFPGSDTENAPKHECLLKEWRIAQ